MMARGRSGPTEARFACRHAGFPRSPYARLTRPCARRAGRHTHKIHPLAEHRDTVVKSVHTSEDPTPGHRHRSHVGAAAGSTVRQAPYSAEEMTVTTTSPSWTHAPVRVGLVGAGPWARAVHARVLAAGPETRLTSVWARRPEAARETAAPHGATVAATFEELLDDCEAVAFSVPPSVQAELAVRAAEAGKALLLEKPLALDLASARRLVDAVDASGVVSQLVLTNRYHPATRRFLAEARALDVSGRAPAVSVAPSSAATSRPRGVLSTGRCWTSGRTSSICWTRLSGRSSGCAAPGTRAAGWNSPASTTTAP